MRKTHSSGATRFTDRVRGVGTTARARAYAIVDVENQTIWDGQRLHPGAARDVVEEIALHVADMPVRAALTESTLQSYLPLLAGRGWGVDCVAVGPDAADWVLIRHSVGAYLQGYDEIVVVSGDRVFAQLAEFAPIHVISHPDRLSRELASVASSVTYLHSGMESHRAA
jgi:hypothetical protein